MADIYKPPWQRDLENWTVPVSDPEAQRGTVMIRVPLGTRKKTKMLAARRGMSMHALIHWLVVAETTRLDEKES